MRIWFWYSLEDLWILSHRIFWTLRKCMNFFLSANLIFEEGSTLIWQPQGHSSSHMLKLVSSEWKCRIPMKTILKHFWNGKPNLYLPNPWRTLDRYIKNILKMNILNHMLLDYKEISLSWKVMCRRRSSLNYTLRRHFHHMNR